MRLCTFASSGAFGTVERTGLQTPGGLVCDIGFAYTLTLAERDGHPRAYELADVLLPPEMVELLANGRFAFDAIREAVDHLGPRIDDRELRGPEGERVVWGLDEITLLAPVPRPRSIRDCLAFEQHVLNSARAAGMDVPQAWYELPVYYKGNPDTVSGPGTTVPWPPYAQILDYELEFAAVIGREGRDLTPDEAWDHIAGWTIFNDVSARDAQLREMPLMLGPAKGKDMDSGNVMGPFLVTADEWDPRHGHTMVARVNGEEWSRGSTADMHHDFGAIVSYVSQGETLHPGDVIGSGTVGTGCGLELGRFPRPGDLVELEIEGLGVLTARFG